MLLLLADLARVGHSPRNPWRASQLFSLRRLIRHRYHVASCLSREKAYMIANIYLKFSSFFTTNDKCSLFLVYYFYDLPSKIFYLHLSSFIFFSLHITTYCLYL